MMLGIVSGEPQVIIKIAGFACEAAIDYLLCGTLSENGKVVDVNLNSVLLQMFKAVHALHLNYSWFIVKHQA